MVRTCGDDADNEMAKDFTKIGTRMDKNVRMTTSHLEATNRFRIE